MNNTTGSGAMGWMMFMPETWAAYGVDANGDGKKDPYDPEDAIYAAARYLRASGAPRNWHDAIFAYNHAEWYVERVMGDFRRFQGAGMDRRIPGARRSLRPHDRRRRDAPPRPAPLPAADLQGAAAPALGRRREPAGGRRADLAGRRVAA